MAPNGPRSEVFTTVLVNQKGMVADWTLHFARMREHAKRLRIDLPDQEPLIEDAGNGRSWRLARVLVQVMAAGSSKHAIFAYGTKPLKPSRWKPNDGTSEPTGQNTVSGPATSRREKPLRQGDAMWPFLFTSTPSSMRIVQRPWSWTRTERCGWLRLTRAESTASRLDCLRRTYQAWVCPWSKGN